MMVERPIVGGEIQERVVDVVPVVRIFPVAPISIEAFRTALDCDPTLSETSLVEVFLAKQLDSLTSDSGKPMLTPLGGKLLEGESLEQASLREVSTDTTMINHSSVLTNSFFSSKEPASPFLYTIPGEEKKRLVYTSVIPVRSSSFSAPSLRKNIYRPNDKKEDIVALNPRQFTAAFTTGCIDVGDGTYKLLDHLVVGETRLVKEFHEQKLRDQSMYHLFREVSALDALWRERVLQTINKMRSFYNRTHYKVVPFATGFRDCSKEELQKGFLAAQMQAALADEHERDRLGVETPPKPADILKLARFLSATPPEHLLDVLVTIPTNPAFAGVRAFRKSIRPVVEVMCEELYKKELPLHVDTYVALQSIWPKIVSLPIAVRASVLAQLNTQFLEHFSRYMGKSTVLVRQAYTIAQKYPTFITENMRALGSHFQEYQPMNEITNAPLVSLVFLALGFHPDMLLSQDAVRSKGMEMVRFESLRMLVLTMTAVEAIEKKEQANNALFESGLNTFLKFPPKMEYIELENGSVHQVLHRSMKDRIDGKSVHLIVEERPAKSIESILRKMYQSPEIFDMHMVNIVVSDDNFPDGGSPIAHCELGVKVRNALLEHLQEQLKSSGTSVSISAGSHRTQVYDRLRSYLAMDSASRKQYIEDLRTGIRPGSEGNRILREKFILEFLRDGKKQYVEINLYPFEKLGSVPELVGSGFMAFEEKIEDDAKGWYTAHRWVDRDAKHPCSPSLLELMYPHELYGPVIEQVKPHQGGRKRR